MPTQNLKVMFPNLCSCCLEAVGAKQYLIISNTYNFFEQMVGFHAKVHVPCCPVCEKHAGLFSGPGGSGFLYFGWLVATVYGLGQVIGKNRPLAVSTPVFWLNVLIVGVILPMVFWFLWHRPRRRATARSLVKPACCRAGLPMEIRGGKFIFYNEAYEQMFIQANARQSN